MLPEVALRGVGEREGAARKAVPPLVLVPGAESAESATPQLGSSRPDGCGDSVEMAVLRSPARGKTLFNEVYSPQKPEDKPRRLVCTALKPYVRTARNRRSDQKLLGFQIFLAAGAVLRTPSATGSRCACRRRWCWCCRATAGAAAPLPVLPVLPVLQVLPVL